jgi:hypothetical protein
MSHFVVELVNRRFKKASGCLAGCPTLSGHHRSGPVQALRTRRSSRPSATGYQGVACAPVPGPGSSRQRACTLNQPEPADRAPPDRFSWRTPVRPLSVLALAGELTACGKEHLASAHAHISGDPRGVNQSKISIFLVGVWYFLSLFGRRPLLKIVHFAGEGLCLGSADGLIDL